MSVATKILFVNLQTRHLESDTKKKEKKKERGWSIKKSGLFSYVL